MREKYDRIKKKPSKYKWEYCDVISLFSLLEVNHRLTLLHMSKGFVYINKTDEHINQFLFGYTVNPTLYDNKLFRDQVEK